MADTPCKRLYEEQGQAPWLDNISRGLISSGELQKMIDHDGIVGVTSNPTIFEKAIGTGTDYDAQMREVYGQGKDAQAVFLELMIRDIQDAADIFRPVYDRTDRLDGYISIEVTPDLARNTAGTLTQVRTFHERLGRPNVLVKIPATAEGVPAIEQAIYEGISINVTLIFAIDRYQAVMEAYLRGLERRHAEGKSLDMASVASFFVSRVDSNVDKKLDALIEKAGSADEKQRLTKLKGKAAIANAKIAYEIFGQVFSGPRWEKLAAAGARVQRPLWASTSTKNPTYRDVLYVEHLIGPDTVDTMPPATIVAFNDHGTVKRTIDHDLPAEHQVIADLAAVGIHMDAVTKELEDEGVASFAKSFETLNGVIAGKRAALAAGQSQNEQTDLGSFSSQVEQTLREVADAADHIWNHDAAWWSPDAAVQGKISDRLGWLGVVDRMIGEADDLRNFAESICKGGFKNVLLMGMGGSSLAPDLFSMEFETADGFPELYVLDSTDPAMIAVCREGLEPADTLYIVSSKSGTTTEPNAFLSYFYERVQQAKGDKAGDNFIAITDPGSPLIAEAARRGFRYVFQNPPDIGGRYSALSYFGLVPAALMGVDVRKLLDRAKGMVVRCGAGVPAADNPGVWLGAVLGTLGNAGHDKVTFITTPGTASFADWAEQLIAESTGKEGRGLVPVSGEETGPPDIYGADRVFVYMPKEGDDHEALDEMVEKLMDAGQPVITLPLADEYDLGGEFFRWELAIAVAGKVLGINPFDEPNVTESKDNTKRLLADYAQTHRLPDPPPVAAAGNLELFAYNLPGFGAAAPTPDPSPEGGGESDGHRLGATAGNTNGKSTTPNLPSPFRGGVGGGGGDQSPGNLPSLRGGEVTPATVLQALFASVQPRDYFAVLAYVETSDDNMDQLEAIRTLALDELQVATTLGFGPRFLHSTGQLHKGGANNGVFLVFTSDEAGDAKIPDLGFSFGTLIRAQALGDIAALVVKGRRVVRIHLVNAEDGLREAGDLIDEVLAGTGVAG